MKRIKENGGMGNRDPYYKPREAVSESDSGTRLAKLLARIAETEDGREFIDEVLTLCGVDTSCYTPDAVAMAYAAGRQAVGMDIERLMRPHDYLILLKERNERRERERYGYSGEWSGGD